MPVPPPSSRALQLSTDHGDAPPTPQQKRFNTLVRQIERARLNLGVWQEGVSAYRQAYGKEVMPLHEAMFKAKREWAFMLDALSDEPGWSRADSAFLSELAGKLAGDLLREKEDDTQLQALFTRHNGIDFETARQQDLQATLEMMQEVTGVDIGDVSDLKSEDEVIDRLHQKMHEEQAAAEAQEETRRQAQAARRRKSPAQKKREAEEQQTTQSLREIFRRLASALHPDRETDPVRRETKTALMQRVNQAYAANDLLALLQLQLEVAQVDAAQIAGAGEEKLRYYNKALAEQLDQLKAEIERVQATFRFDAHLPPDMPINPAKLGELIKQIKRELREHVAQLKQEMRMLADPAAAKRWLKQYRRAV